MSGGGGYTSGGGGGYVSTGVIGSGYLSHDGMLAKPVTTPSRSSLASSGSRRSWRRRRQNNSFGSDLANWGASASLPKTPTVNQSPPSASTAPGSGGSGRPKHTLSSSGGTRSAALATTPSKRTRRSARKKKRSSDPNAWRSMLGLDGKSDPQTRSAYASPEILHPRTGKPIDPLKYKTAICSHFAKSSGCEFGSNCIFAHGHEELFRRKLEIKRIKAEHEERKRQHDERLLQLDQQQSWVGMTSATDQQQQKQQQRQQQSNVSPDSYHNKINYGLTPKSVPRTVTASKGIRGIASDIWSPPIGHSPPPGFGPSILPANRSNSSNTRVGGVGSSALRPPLSPDLSPGMSPATGLSEKSMPPLIPSALGGSTGTSPGNTLSPLTSSKGSLRRIKSAPKQSLQWPSPPKLVSTPELDVKKKLEGGAVALSDGVGTEHIREVLSQNNQIGDISSRRKHEENKEKEEQALQTESTERGSGTRTDLNEAEVMGSDSAGDTPPRQPAQSTPVSDEKVLVLENEVKRLRKALFLQQKQREAKAKDQADWEEEKRVHQSNPQQQTQLQAKVLQKRPSDSKHSKRALEDFERRKQQKHQFMIKLLAAAGLMVMLLLVTMRYFAARVSSEASTGSGSSTDVTDEATKNYRQNDILWVKTDDRGWRLAKVANAQAEEFQHIEEEEVLMVHLLSSNSNSGRSSGSDSGMPSEPHYMAFRVGDQTKKVHPALLADRSSFKSFGLIIPMLASDALHNEDASLAEETCLSLGDLARSSLHRATIHSTTGALAAVVKTLGFFQESESLQMACILAIGNLAQADSATIKELKETGERE